MEIRKAEWKYPYVEEENRSAIVPERNVISIAPATKRDEYLYTGNGHFFLEYAGGVEQDEIIVTEEHLYEPLWKNTPLPPNLGKDIDRIREYVLKGETDRVDEIIDLAQREAGYDKMMNMDADIVYPIGSPRVHKALSFSIAREGIGAGQVHDYLRYLDLETGAVTSRFETDALHKTSMAASFEENYTAISFQAPKGKLNLSVGIELPGGPNVWGVPTMVGSTHQWFLNGTQMILAWQYNPELTSKGYYAILRVASESGELEITPKCIRLQKGEQLEIFVKVIKIEKNFTFDGYREYANAFDAVDKSFQKVVEGNRRILGAKMRKSSLHLGKPEDAYLSGEELLRKSHSEEELYPMLLDKLYDMGRFFQIVDTGDIPPMWGQHNINTNLQVCAGNNTGLFEEMDVYFRYYEEKFEDFRTNAKPLFNARGLLASVHCDPDSGLYYHFSKTYPHYCFTGVLGWVYNEFWGYYLTTGDEVFLAKRVVPALKEIALFYEDYACLKDKDGKSIFVPSFSPEDPTPNPDFATVTCADHHATRINSVMDVAICREVLTNLIEACTILGIERENIGVWQKQLEELPIYLLDEEGGLKEWAWESMEENYNHRHVSHHYDLYPGRAVTVDKEPLLAQAIRISNRKRGQQDDSAHGIIHRAFCSLRLKDVEEFTQNMSQLISHGFVGRNLATFHFPYRMYFPDLQGAMPALLLEMCVYSQPGMVEFLPALPEVFKEGEIQGIWLYTFAKLEKLCWNENGLKATLRSDRAQEIAFRLRKPVASVCINRSQIPPRDGKIVYAFEAGETVEIEILYGLTAFETEG